LYQYPLPITPYPLPLNTVRLRTNRELIALV
jgi:hypothetical protein